MLVRRKKRRRNVFLVRATPAVCHVRQYCSPSISLFARQACDGYEAPSDIYNAIRNADVNKVAQRETRKHETRSSRPQLSSVTAGGLLCAAVCNYLYVYTYMRLPAIEYDDDTSRGRDISANWVIPVTIP